MDNYEINILRRGGNWKKVKPDDLIVDEINNDLKESNELNQQKSQWAKKLSKLKIILIRKLLK